VVQSRGQAHHRLHVEQDRSWNYSATAVNKAGKTKVRLTMFHEAKKFKRKKWISINASNGTCKTQWK
jgi:hypothetical protein